MQKRAAKEQRASAKVLAIVWIGYEMHSTKFEHEIKEIYAYAKQVDIKIAFDVCNSSRTVAEMSRIHLQKALSSHQQNHDATVYFHN